jgi:uncharacterized membrane protein
VSEGASGPAWSATDSIGFAWRRIGKKPEAILVLLVAALCGQALALPGGIVGALLEMSGDRDAKIAGIVIRIATNILNIPISVFFTMGAVRYTIKIARGEEAGFGDIFTGGPYLAFLGSTLLVGLGTFGGFLLCIVPGILLAICWSFYGQFVVDKGAGALDSMSMSWDLTRGRRGDLFVLWLLLFGLNLLGLLACCVGVFVTGPMTQIAIAWVYLRLTGQETAA